MIVRLLVLKKWFPNTIAFKAPKIGRQILWYMQVEWHNSLELFSARRTGVLSKYRVKVHSQEAIGTPRLLEVKIEVSLQIELGKSRAVPAPSRAVSESRLGDAALNLCLFHEYEAA